MAAMNPFVSPVRGTMQGTGPRVPAAGRCCLVAGALLAAAIPATCVASPALPAASAVRDKMVAVATWQEAHPSRWPALDWTRAPYYLGLLATARVTGEEKWADAVRAVGREQGWRLGKHPFMADDHAVGQAWLALYQQDRLPEQLATVEAGIQAFAERPVERSLEWKGQIHDREWAWCDALFMGPPLLAAMTTASGDRGWLGRMDERYWHTCDYLLDPGENLFARDSSFFEKREANGSKVFWSRGNGWVFAGLVHILQHMPADHPTRSRYVDLFGRMAKRLIELQHADGTWHASLLDPAAYPVPESSGTAFFCYGLLWGVNQGMLGREAALPAALRAWQAISNHVHPDGMLGFVQPCGTSPQRVTAAMTEVYGTGGFLLAGSELSSLIRCEDSRRADFQVLNPTQHNRLFDVASIAWEEVARILPGPDAGRIVVRDMQTGHFVASRVLDDTADGKPDRLQFRATVLPGQSRLHQLVEMKHPPDVANRWPLQGPSVTEPLLIKTSPR